MSKVDYEYPFSPPAETETPFATSKHSLTPEPSDMASIPTPSTATSTSPTISSIVAQARRGRTPPKNSAGQMTCDHDDCHNNPPIFHRRCEWHKHMDRHERPYKCQQPGCESAQGFTYSGGLLRHQREVHKINVPNKALLYCDIQDCERNAGPGFTRKENLEEHKRRKHSRIPVTNGDISMQSRKRKRPITPQDSDGVPDDQEDDMLLRTNPYVQRLEQQLAQKDNMIGAQANEIQRLTNLLRSIPVQTIYHTNNSLMSPPVRHNGHLTQRNGSSGMM